MHPREARYLLAYNRWANARTLDAASRLDPARFTRGLGSSYSSVRDTLVHVLWAEWIWLRRWEGESPKEILDPAGFGSVPEIRTRWRTVEEGQAAFGKALSPGALARVLTYVNTSGEAWSYPLARMIQHVVNHSTYHRGQVAAMLRQLGAEPLPTDLLIFVDEGEPGAEPAP